MDRAGIAVLQAAIAKQNKALKEDAIMTPPKTKDASISSVIGENTVEFNKLNRYIENSKKAIGESLMTLAIGAVFDKVLNEQDADMEDYLIGHKMINTLVKEQGYNNLIKRFSRQNLTLSEMARYCEMYREAITEGVIDTIKQKAQLAGNELNYTGQKFADRFEPNKGVGYKLKRAASRGRYEFNKLAIKHGPSIKQKLSIVRDKFRGKDKTVAKPYGESVEDAYNYFTGNAKPVVKEEVDLSDYTFTINESDLIGDNMDVSYKLDKAIADDFIDDIKDVIPDRAIMIIQDRVSSSMQDFIDRNNENKAAIMDIYDRASKRISGMDDGGVKDDILESAKHRVNEVYSRSSGVLNAIVKGIAESVVKKDELKKIYMDEAGHLDMDKVVNSGLVMYTVLEELNTMEMIDFTPDYLKKTLKSIS